MSRCREQAKIIAEYRRGWGDYLGPEKKEDNFTMGYMAEEGVAEILRRSGIRARRLWTPKKRSDPTDVLANETIRIDVKARRPQTSAALFVDPGTLFDHPNDIYILARVEDEYTTPLVVVEGWVTDIDVAEAPRTSHCASYDAFRIPVRDLRPWEEFIDSYTEAREETP